MMKRLLIGSLLALASLTTATRAQEVVIDGLYNPCGITVQPETGTLFVADSGNRRIVRIVDGAAQDVIVEFGKDVYGKGPMYDIGPLGIAFLDQETLVVGGGGAPDGEEALFVYKIPAAGEPAINAADAAASFTLAATDEIKGEGNFYGVAVTNNAIHITSNGDDTKGWVLRSVITDGKPGKLEGFIATKQDVAVDAPCAITVDKSGDLVIGQMGEVNVAADSLLLVYDAKTGKLKKQYETGLSDIIGLAYSPVTGKLYATDFSWVDATKGGLFELTIEGDKCTARKVASLDKPTAIAFDAKGHAYVTTFGTAEEGAKGKPGKLFRIAKGQL